MHYLLGTDEAGYGPNLGPLVISASLWSVAEGDQPADLYRRLDKVVSSRLKSPEPSERIPICDSKALYKPGRGLAALERGVLPLLDIAGIKSATWRDLMNGLDPASHADRQRVPWYRDYDGPLPADLSPNGMRSSTAALRDTLAAERISILAVRSTIVYPQRFNALIEQFGNKATALTHATLQLINGLTASIDRGAIFIVCDKHGGRNKYGSALQQMLPDNLIEVHHEGRSESLYRTGPRERRLEFRFRSKGENELPPALASMVSKYVRELSMAAFNQYWTGRQPGLRPTAGYPVDAQRFRREIAATQQGLQIPDHLLWRSR